MQFKTTAAYVSGGICGEMWMPCAMAGKPVQKNLRGPWGIMDRFTSPASFRDALLSLLMEEGGDFQAAQFTSDTVIRVERIAHDGNYRKIHVWEREVSAITDCADLVNADAYTGDFMGGDD